MKTHPLSSPMRLPLPPQICSSSLKIGEDVWKCPSPTSTQGSGTFTVPIILLGSHLPPKIKSLHPNLISASGISEPATIPSKYHLKFPLQPSSPQGLGIPNSCQQSLYMQGALRGIVFCMCFYTDERRSPQTPLPFYDFQNTPWGKRSLNVEQKCFVRKNIKLAQSCRIN